MTGLLTGLSIAGGLAVLTFLVFVVVGLQKGWRDTASKRVLRVFYGFAGACAVLGVLVAFTSGG